MKLYTLTAIIEHESWDLMGVFDSREKANQAEIYLKATEGYKHIWDYWEIEEIELNKIINIL